MLRGRPRSIRLRKRLKRRMHSAARKGAASPNAKRAAMARRRVRRKR